MSIQRATPREINATGQILHIFIPDSTHTGDTQAGKTGLTNASAGLKITVASEDAGGTGSISSAGIIAYSGSTIVAPASPQPWANPGAGKVGFSEVDATNAPGLYCLHLENAVFSGPRRMIRVCVFGASGAAVAVLEVPLTGLALFSSGAANLTQIDGTVMASATMNLKNLVINNSTGSAISLTGGGSGSAVINITSSAAAGKGIYCYLPGGGDTRGLDLFANTGVHLQGATYSLNAYSGAFVTNTITGSIGSSAVSSGTAAAAGSISLQSIVKDDDHQRVAVYATLDGAGLEHRACLITATLSRDGGVPAATDTTHPTEIGGGVYEWDLRASSSETSFTTATLIPAWSTNAAVELHNVYTTGGSTVALALAGDEVQVDMRASVATIQAQINAMLVGADTSCTVYRYGNANGESWLIIVLAAGYVLGDYGVNSVDLGVGNTCTLTLIQDGDTAASVLSSPVRLVGVPSVSTARLSSDGLDDVAATEPEGVASTWSFRERLMWLVRRFSNKTVMTKVSSNSATLAVRNDADTDDLSTQACARTTRSESVGEVP